MASDTDGPRSAVTSKSEASAAVSFSQKRERNAESSDLSLNNLDNSLLIEIFCRLPAARSAIKCKSVCKLWYSLISDPHFVSRFINHHINNSNSDDDNDGHDHDVSINYGDDSTLVINFGSPYEARYNLVTVSNEPIFKFGGFQLGFLPESRERIQVLASFNDLLLCCVKTGTELENRHKEVENQHYICNPFTKQWIALPLLTQKYRGTTTVGFICEPYYYRKEAEFGINYEYRYRVVRITRTANGRCYLNTYISETKEWLASTLLGRRYCIRSNIVAYNRKLHWFNGKDIVAYDPFNNGQCCYIDASEIKTRRVCSYCLGVCKGFLRVMRVAIGGKDDTLTVWDYRRGKLRLQDEVYFSAMVSETGWISQQFIPRSWHNAVAQGFHPTDNDVVYWWESYHDVIMSCNLRTRELKAPLELPRNYPVYKFYIGVFPVVLPWWPVPLPPVS